MDRSKDLLNTAFAKCVSDIILQFDIKTDDCKSTLSQILLSFLNNVNLAQSQLFTALIADVDINRAFTMDNMGAYNVDISEPNLRLNDMTLSKIETYTPPITSSAHTSMAGETSNMSHNGGRFNTRRTLAEYYSHMSRYNDTHSIPKNDDIDFENDFHTPGVVVGPPDSSDEELYLVDVTDRPYENQVVEGGEIEPDGEFIPYDSLHMSQCCARIGNIKHRIATYGANYLDKYPAGTFQTKDGYVFGDPCYNVISNREFDEGNIYCIDHCDNPEIEDIREIPSNSNYFGDTQHANKQANKQANKHDTKHANKQHHKKTNKSICKKFWDLSDSDTEHEFVETTFHQNMQHNTTTNTTDHKIIIRPTAACTINTKTIPIVPAISNTFTKYEYPNTNIFKMVKHHIDGKDFMIDNESGEFYDMDTYNTIMSIMEADRITNSGNTKSYTNTYEYSEGLQNTNTDISDFDKYYADAF